MDLYTILADIVTNPGVRRHYELLRGYYQTHGLQHEAQALKSLIEQRFGKKIAAFDDPSVGTQPPGDDPPGPAVAT